jgi:cell division protein ZapD
VISNITYEQPLNERVRTFLRLEHLFDTEDHFLSNSSEWDSRVSLSLLLDIIDMLSRSDVKTELIKEMERHSVTLTNLKRNPGVDLHRLEMILDDINLHLEVLRGSSYQPGQLLRQDELITSIKQRSSIPGGSCNFDLPAYHHWLQHSLEERHANFENWRKDLLVIKKSVRLALHMIRNSANPVIEEAQDGFFQKPIEGNIACQMVRVLLPAGSIYFPEISGGKHRFTVRFFQQTSTAIRPMQTKDTVEFELHCCIL